MAAVAHLLLLLTLLGAGMLPNAFLNWSGKPGSNRRPQPWQGCALPTELFPHTPKCLALTKWRPVGGSNPCSRRERAVS